MFKYLILLSAAVPAIAAAQTQDVASRACIPVIDLDGGEAEMSCTEEDFLIVVPGNREGQTGLAVSVIDRAGIEQVQGPDLTRVLERVPAASFSRNGPVGAVTSLRLRGGEAEQVLVLVDGVPVADPASPGAGFDFGNLLPGGIRRIEVLRGSNSTLWGSQAMAGTVAIESARPDGVSASLEYGANESLYATGGAGISSETGSAIGLTAGYYRSDGFSAAASGTEPDGFEQWSVGGNGRVVLSPNLAAFASASYRSGELDIDGFPAPDFILTDTDEVQDTEQVFAVGGLELETGGLRLVGSYQMADTARENFSSRDAAAPSFTADGTTERVALRGRYHGAGPLTVQFGAEQEWSRFETLFAARQERDSKAAFAQLEYDRGGVHLAAGARVDDYDDFGSEVSLGGDALVELDGGFALRASYGEGFKAPSLFQLLSDFGNASLLPERSRSYEVGIDFGRGSDLFSASLGAFRRDTENQIEFVSCFGSTDPICVDRPFGTYDNIGMARAQGIELGARLRPTDALTVQAAYAFIDTENRTVGSPNEGNTLARRPEHALTLSGDWRMWQDLSVGADLRVVSDSFDDAGNFTSLDGYEVVTLRAAVPLSEKIELFGRVENVFDANYQTAAGYGTQGRAGFVGIRLR